MKLLLQNVQIADGHSILSARDIYIQNGVIQEIGTGLKADADTKIWDCSGLYASPGWMDIGTQSCDPGYEHREDLQSASQAAAAGGFTAIANFPNTSPAIHSKSEILYIRNKTAGQAVDFYPIGAISEGCEGKDLAELYDMHHAGAIAFSDGKKAIQDAGLLLRALQYAQAFKGLVMNIPHHKTIAASGQMHEGLTSTMLGLKGIPALAETLMVQRDLSLLEYAGGRLHIHLLSAAESVDLIRAAKKSGLQVSCSVAVANLCEQKAPPAPPIRGGVPTASQEADAASSEAVTAPPRMGGPGGAAPFDSNWKVLPPVRDESDRLALLDGLADGTIDFICSNHTPWDIEAKNLEFTYAEFGMSTLETAFSMYRTFFPEAITLNQWVEKIALAPRRVLGLPLPAIEKGAEANLTIFNPDQRWTLLEDKMHSKSANTPFLGQTLRGKVAGIIHHKQVLTVI